jgi:kynureninase
MTNEFEPIPGANGFRLSNPSMLSVISLKASLDIFDQTSMKELCAISRKLTGHLERLIDEKIDKQRVQIITPRDPKQRGCQLSLLFLKDDMLQVHAYLDKHGITCDERKPNVIRVAPAPLYNTKADVDEFVRVLADALQATESNGRATAKQVPKTRQTGHGTEKRPSETATQSPVKSPKKARNESTV